MVSQIHILSCVFGYTTTPNNTRTNIVLMLNKLFLKLKCTETKDGFWYVTNHPTHNIYVHKENNKNNYMVEILDGSNLVSSFHTNNLWSI